MSRVSVSSLIVAVVIGLTLSTACQNNLMPVEAAGTYMLTSTIGTIGRSETPVSGSLVLTPNGSAERRVSYQLDSTGALTELIAIGTYRVSDSIVHLSLREDSGQSSFTWQVAATLETGGDLRLSYPRPADGTIVELYQRR